MSTKSAPTGLQVTSLPVPVELSLYGVIADTELQKLLARLKAIYGSHTPIHEHELVFVPKKTDASSSGADATARLRYTVNSKPFVEQDLWTLVHYGNAEPTSKRFVNSRNIVTSAVKGPILEMLKIFDFTFNFEFVRKGYCFSSKTKPIRVSIQQIYKLGQRHNLESNENLNENQWLIEASAITVSEGVSEMTQELSTVAQYLSNLVHLSTVDHKLLHQPTNL